MFKLFFLTKRQKIIITAVIYTVGLIVTQRVGEFWIDEAIIGLMVVVFLSSLWALREGMNKVKVLTVLMLPVLFSLGSASTLLLVKYRFLFKLPILLFFGILFYFLMLGQNVFNVAAQRTIPLYRAAATAGFVFTIVTSVMLYHGVHTFSWDFLGNGLAIAGLTLLLVLPAFWSVEMENVTFRHIVYSLVLALVIGEIGLVMSFWPIPPDSWTWAVALGSMLFICLGVCLDSFRERLSKFDLYMYFGLGLFVFGVVFLTTRWTG